MDTSILSLLTADWEAASWAEAPAKPLPWNVSWLINLDPVSHQKHTLTCSRNYLLIQRLSP